MNQFNWKHYIFIATAFVVVPIKTYTSIYLKETGNESWITLIIASIILCLYVFISMRIFTKNNCYNISEIYQVALGNLIGKVFFGLSYVNHLDSLDRNSSCRYQLATYESIIRDSHMVQSSVYCGNGSISGW